MAGQRGGKHGEHDALLAVADDLYAGDLGGFTAARDTRAAAAKATDPELAKQVKALRKPTVAAWALNLFVRAEGEQVDQLLALGESLREAQQALDGDELRALTRQRRQLTAAMTDRVRGTVGDRGQRLTQSVADQVEATLTAALLDEQVAVALRSGLLVQPVSSTGVDTPDLTGVVAVPEALGFTAPPRAVEPPEPVERPRLRVVPDPDETRKKRRAARAELAEAERVLGRAGRALRAHDRKVADLEAKALQVQAQIDEVRRRLAELEDTAEQVDADLAEAAEERDDAAAELADAEAERDDARAVLEALEED